MIFILTEQIMNGTVCMQVKTTLIEGESWEEAYDKLREFVSETQAHNVKEDSDSISYTIPGRSFDIWGRLDKNAAVVV
jgi:hypothetical protein